MTAGSFQTPGPRRERPIRVTGGLRLSSGAGAPTSWAAQRWMRLAESSAPGENLAEGLEYARLGQTRSMDITPGRVRGRVQGRRSRAYDTSLGVGEFSREECAAIERALAEQAGPLAALLAGTLPPTIEEVFEPLGLRLAPSAAEVSTTCDCAGGAWCKHACCLAALTAERLAAEPFLLFRLRGVDPDDLLTGLRRLRTASAGGTAPAALLGSAAPVGAAASRPLDADLESFWTAGHGLDTLETSPRPAEVRHPLLRRLGPSPFGKGFPLLGLLATCYDIASKDAVERDADQDVPAVPGPPDASLAD